MSCNVGEITLLLNRLELGHIDAVDELFPLLQPEMHKIAEHLLRRERSSHTLQPTMLVDDAFESLSRPRRRRWKGRQHFYAFAAHNMRERLIDGARRRNAIRRGQGAANVPLEEARFVPLPEAFEKQLDLKMALERLREVDSRQALIVQLRCMMGFSVQETVEALGICKTTVKTETQLGIAFLKHEMGAVQ